MKFSRTVQLLAGFIISIFSMHANAQSVFLEPTKEELNLPFQINDGRIEIHIPNFRNRTPGADRLVAQCKMNYNANGVTEEIEVFVWKNNLAMDALVNSKSKGVVNTVHYPFVFQKTFRKESLGQYSTAVEVAQMMGITKVDSIRVFFIDSDLNHLNDLVFFYDDEGFVIDKTIYVHNHWLRCNQ